METKIVNNSTKEEIQIRKMRKLYEGMTKDELIDTLVEMDLEVDRLKRQVKGLDRQWNQLWKFCSSRLKRMN